MSNFYRNNNRAKWKRFLLGCTIYQKISRIYFLIIILGAALLTTPISHQKNDSFSFFQAVFTSVSAFTNTGLVVVNTSETFNLFGQIVILFLIQMGGMGFLTIFLILFFWIRKKLKMSMERMLFLNYERGGLGDVNSFDVAKTGIIVLLVTELIGAVLLTIFFFLSDHTSGSNGNSSNSSPKGNFLKSLWFGIFHSVSAANNAGFDLIGSSSISPYNTGARNFFSAVLLVEAIIGGIGYPLFYEIKEYWKSKRRKTNQRFSLSFKLNIVSYFLIAFVGAILGVAFEFKHKIENFSGSESDRLWNVIYLTFSSRSSGFSGLEISKLKESTQWLLNSLMFIGANPASTGGGVRAIVIFIVFSKMAYILRGKKHLSMFKKTISPDIIFSSFQVFVISIVFVSVATFIILCSNPEIKLSNAIFESSSAFGTAGLTSGLTEKSNWIVRVVLMMLMFVGQLGPYNALISITGLQSKKRDCEYDSPNIRIT